MINILLIDNNIVELELINEYVCRSHPMVNLVTLDYLPSIELCLDFDGVILDFNLGTETSGLTYAAEVSKRNWLLPIMLYTGDISATKDAELIVDYVCFKNDILSFTSKLDSLVRQISRLQHLRGILNVDVPTINRQSLQ